MTEVLTIKQLHKLKPQSESQLQSECVKWFHLKYPKYASRLFAIPNGGLRSKITAARLKREGALAGVLDLFLAVPKFLNEDEEDETYLAYHGLFIEMKTPDGTLSDNQKQFIQAVQDDYKYVICRSVDEFMREVEEYLK